MTAGSNAALGIVAAQLFEGCMARAAAIQALYVGCTMSMKVCGSSEASDTAKVTVRLASPGPPSPTLFGIVFGELCSLEYPSAGVKCQDTCAPRLFHADDVGLLPALARGLQYC